MVSVVELPIIKGLIIGLEGGLCCLRAFLVSLIWLDHLYDVLVEVKAKDKST